ncbi:hypothetical protein IZU89_08585 [Cellulophaga lytica]|uniref:hypothetical protein n=1 Tax=Cellulophaga lytica TaxID=979 RepID=UPI0032E4C033
MKNLKDFTKNTFNLKSANLIFGGETISTERWTMVNCVDEHVDKNNNGSIDPGEDVYLFECED